MAVTCERWITDESSFPVAGETQRDSTSPSEIESSSPQLLQQTSAVTSSSVNTTGIRQVSSSPAPHLMHTWQTIIQQTLAYTVTIACERLFAIHHHFSTVSLFTALVQRTANCSQIQNTILTPDKQLNVSNYSHSASMKSSTSENT